MGSHLLQMANLDRRTVAPTTITSAVDPTHTQMGSTSTIAPYATGLNGVNQSMNSLFRDALWWSLGIVALIVLLIRIIELLWAKLRQVSAMTVTRDRQVFWRTAQWDWMPILKKHLIYAPLWSKRHNREIRLSSAINVGTLPSRLHLILLCLYGICNFAYILDLDWSLENQYSVCAELRGRSGTLGLVNMVPLIILAGRNNPLIPLLKISFDTYNLFHRWLGRIVIIEIFIHTLAWTIVQVASEGWASIGVQISNESFIGSGFVGALAMAFIFILSLSPVRHAFYETFLNGHILLAFIVFVCTWVHCGTANMPGGLPQLPYVMAIMALWFADRVVRFVRLAYSNWSDRGFSDAVCEALPGEVTRVTIRLPRYLNVQPGTHAYLRFWGINPWESHPFSIAWVQHRDANALPRPVTEEKNSYLPQDRSNVNTEITFCIGAQTGMTRKLYEKASKAANLRIYAAVEGPYAGHHSLDSYGHAVLFAGSTGITHQVSYIRHLLEGYQHGIVATRKVTLIWVIRDHEALDWIRPFMDEILQIPSRKDVLRVQIYVTRPRNPDRLVSESTTVNIFPGRPQIRSLLEREVSEQTGAMAVTVCGPGALADDVRDAVRGVQRENVVDFVEESFTW